MKKPPFGGYKSRMITRIAARIAAMTNDIRPR